MGRENIINFIGFSNSGKTSLISQIVSLLSDNFKVVVIKHSNKNFEMDKEGKDSWRIYHSGADILILSPVKMAYLTHENDSLNSILDMLEGYDVYLTEGFKNEFRNGILVLKEPDELETILKTIDPMHNGKIRAIVCENSDEKLKFWRENIDCKETTKILDKKLKVFTPDDIEKITDFVLKLSGLR